MNTRLEPKMIVGWHDVPKAHQSFTDIFFCAYVNHQCLNFQFVLHSYLEISDFAFASGEVEMQIDFEIFESLNVLRGKTLMGKPLQCILNMNKANDYENVKM